ncbi:MAG: flagellar hook-basal body complex protein FliE [Lawsonibacter sp.]|nr:flagellar hook-basal body complex protein FliE [Lawsonibacter sp.]
MEFTPIQSIAPLWSTPVEGADAAQSAPAGTLFADVFRQAIQNVRETNQEQVNLEYQLSVGLIDNPAELNLAISKATTSALLLMEMRNKALDAYNELMRISL